MKNTMKLFLMLLVITQSVMGQKKGILLTRKTDNDTEFYRENKRVRIETSDGKSHTGRIKIIDDATLSIDEDNIEIATIVKIQSQSLVSTIFSTLYIGTGIIIIVEGVTLGGIGVILVPLGLIDSGFGLLIPEIGNSHKKFKWDYKIVQDYVPSE
jgi:small nuclear ribonucleoprotein (snRNP)-like protein